MRVTLHINRFLFFQILLRGVLKMPCNKIFSLSENYKLVLWAPHVACAKSHKLHLTNVTPTTHGDLIRNAINIPLDTLDSFFDVIKTYEENEKKYFDLRLNTNGKIFEKNFLDDMPSSSGIRFTTSEDGHFFRRELSSAEVIAIFANAGKIKEAISRGLDISDCRCDEDDPFFFLVSCERSGLRRSHRISRRMFRPNVI